VKKRLLEQIDECTALYRDEDTGIAWVENGHTGNGHTCHPNIHHTGSVNGMKRLGYWRHSDITVRSHGFIYNISKFTVSDEFDRLAAKHCRCGGNHGNMEKPSND